jgi:cell wall-associated NlpC family hydrolase
MSSGTPFTAISEQSLDQSEDPAPDIPADDSTELPPDEGDIDQEPQLDAPVTEYQPETALAAISPAHSDQDRKTAVQAAILGLRNRAAIHYNKDNATLRWDGINHHRLASKGQFPHYADCSSFVTWCLWNVLRNRPDTVNGQKWRAGYTGTMIKHGTRVTEAAIKPGDVAFYDHHVAIYIGGGFVISHGKEIGPLKVHLHYRKLNEIRRYLGA